jgi:Rod binding domain-containing protein
MAEAITSNNTPTSSYLDFSGLGELRGRAQQNDPTALKQAAKHFEGAFIQMMLKSMRDANSVMKSDLIKSDAIDTFQDMFDKELSTQMANRNNKDAKSFQLRQTKTTQMPQAKPFIKPLPVRPLDISQDNQP